jgi:protease-4
MRTLIVAMVVTVALAATACADIISDPWIRGASSVAVNDDATAVFVNPAGLGMYNEQNSYTALSMSGDAVSRFALAIKAGALGFGYDRQYLWESGAEEGSALRPSDDAIDTYTIALALAEERRFSLGFGYRMIHSQFGSKETAGTWDAGIMIRPWEFLSVGGALRNISEPDFDLGVGDGARDECECGSKMSYVAGLALRPIGNRLTLMADAALERNDDVENAVYTAGVEARVIDGVTLRGSIQSFPDGDDRETETSAGLWFNATHVGGGASYRTFDAAADDIITYEVGSSGERMLPLFTPRGRVAEVKIEGPLTDFRAGWSLFGKPQVSAQGVIREIRKAAKDPSIDVILLRIRPLGSAFLGAPTAMVQEIRDEVLRAREAYGVETVAFLEYGAATPEYFLASAADAIIMDPTSGIEGIGNYVNVMRFTGTTEKLGIEWDYISAGKYKSTFHSIGAGPLTDEQRVEVQSLVDDNYEEILAAVMAGRAMSRDEAEGLCDGRMFSPPQAIDAGLVDELGDHEHARAVAVGLATGERPEDPEEASTVNVGCWRDKAYDWVYGPKIAIVGAYGGIDVGKGGTDPIRGGQSIGSETLVEQLRRARKDDSVKAVVLRVDSGGGSALASDIIWRETVKVAEEKPFIVSMADIAGSGGYYIAIAAEKIFVEPLTLTGSIGVVGMKPVFEPLFQKIDTTYETFKKGEHSDQWGGHRHMTEDEYAMGQEMIDWFYDDFLAKVADGRGLPIEVVQEAAQGRVYTGNQGIEAGIVDELGGLSAAIDYACEKVGVAREDARILYYREGVSLMERIARDVTAKLGLWRLLDFGDVGVGEFLQLRTRDVLVD